MYWLLTVLSVSLLTGIDQWIKYLVVQNFSLYESREFLKLGSLPLINLTYTLNDGAAFSSFSGKRLLLILLPCAMLLLCAFYFVKEGKGSKWLTVSLILIMSGGIGNLIDRIRAGLVVDYLDLQLFEFPVFNFADCCICVGAAMVCIYELFLRKDPNTPKKESQNV